MVNFIKIHYQFKLKILQIIVPISDLFVDKIQIL